MCGNIKLKYNFVIFISMMYQLFIVELFYFSVATIPDILTI